MLNGGKVLIMLGEIKALSYRTGLFKIVGTMIYLICVINMIDRSYFSFLSYES
jgi:hypothetical protein